jgi:hypothetical protein
MHVRENHMIVEIIGKNAKPVRDGEYGELVITTIGMEIMPLIRYRTNDRARILPEPCPCGAVTSKIEVEGRLDQNLRMSDIDEALFTMNELVDVKAEFVGNVLELKAYVLGEAQIQKEIQKRVSSLFSDRKIKIHTQICNDDCMSLYPAKRVIG